MNKDLIEQLKKDGAALLLTDKLYRRYFSGIDMAEGFLLVSDKTYYFADARYFFALKEKLSGSEVVPVLYDGLKSIDAVLKENGIKKIGLDYDHTTLTEFEGYKSFGTGFYDASATIKKLRSVKSDEEIALMKKACEITEKSFHIAIKELKEGMTEKQFADRLRELYLSFGAEGESFDTIVAFGDGSAVPHHETGDTVLKKESVVLVDTGCFYQGYASDYTRTVYFGNNPDPEFVRCYNAVKRANDTAEETITDGFYTDDADNIARNVLKEENIDKYFTHSLGHGLGLEIHEFPALSFKKRDMLKNGMAFTIEPGVYFDGRFGIRIEDTVMLKDGKLVRLFTDSKDLCVIECK